MRKKVLILLFLVANSMILSAQQKSAIVAIHYGTSNTQAKEKTIDAFNEQLKKLYPEYDFFEAWRSKIIVKSLKKKGVNIDSPDELFIKLKKDGYKQVLVQPSMVSDGTEMLGLRISAANIANDTFNIVMGEPLLYKIDDFQNVVSILNKLYPSNEKKAVVWCGHGTQMSPTASYAMIESMLRDKQANNTYVATIEGYPTFESLIKKLKTGKYKEVELLPLLFNAGNHMKEDIIGEWKPRLESEGYKVTILQTSLGEISEIQNLYMQHAKQLENDEN